jgi:hypothetical protein
MSDAFVDLLRILKRCMVQNTNENHGRYKVENVGGIIFEVKRFENFKHTVMKLPCG